MSRPSRPRARRLNDGVDSLVRRLIEKPVKEAVREALEEERRGPSDTDDGGSGSHSRVRRAAPVLLAFFVAAFLVRRRRRSRSARTGYESDVEGTAAGDEGGDGEPIHVEAASED